MLRQLHVSLYCKQSESYISLAESKTYGCIKVWLDIYFNIYLALIFRLMG
jgi:hypothetical protein